MSQQPQFPQRTKTILDDASLRLFADPLPNATGKGTMKVYPNAKNSVRLDIFTNVPNEKNNGNIRADVPYTDMQALCDLLLYLAMPTTPNDEVYRLDYEDFQFFNGKRSETKQLIYSIFAGKTEAGRIYISVKLPEAGRSVIQFFLDSAIRLQIKRVKGGDMSDAEISALATRAWVNRITPLLNEILPTVWVDKAAQRAQNGGGQGGGRNGGGNNYGNRNNNGGGYGGGQQGYGNGGQSTNADELPF